MPLHALKTLYFSSFHFILYICSKYVFSDTCFNFNVKLFKIRLCDSFVLDFLCIEHDCIHFH